MINVNTEDESTNDSFNTTNAIGDADDASLTHFFDYNINCDKTNSIVDSPKVVNVSQNGSTSSSSVFSFSTDNDTDLDATVSVTATVDSEDDKWLILNEASFKRLCDGFEKQRAMEMENNNYSDDNAQEVIF